MTVELYHYQSVGVRRIERFAGRALLADEMGLGKTIQALYWAQNYLDKCDRIVVVCPASVKWNWQSEAANKFGIRGEVLSGLHPPDALPRAPLLIINYDILFGRRNQRRSWLTMLQSLKPALVIIDECHYIKSPSAKRTKAVKQLCHGVPHVIGVSGTPLTNRPVELFPILSIICPWEFPSFTEFAWRYCQPQVTPWGMEFKGATNLEELHHRLARTCMIRRRKRDVLKQLPAKTRTVVPMELAKADLKEYQRAELDFVSWLREISPAVAQSAKRAEYLVRKGYLKRLAGYLKMRQVIEWLENFLINTDEKLLFFGYHKKFLRPIYQQFKQLSVFVDGSVTGHKRQTAFDAFTRQSQKRMLVGNIDAAGIGWNGQAASHVVFGELDWVPGKHTQAEDRTHRIGQLNPVVCHYLVSRGTIEEDLCAILQRKQKTLTSTLDGTDEIDLDIMTKLDQLLLQRHE